jgi:hypothetical protein
VAPSSAPWVPSSSPTPFQSETKYWNQFRAKLRMEKLQFESDFRLDMRKLRIYWVVPRFNIPIDIYFEELANIAVNLSPSRQTISDTKHAISFQSGLLHLLYFISQTDNFKT